MAQQARVLPLGGENEIRHMFEEFESAMRAKDIERIMSYYAPEVIAFDIMPPLQFANKEQYRKSWELSFEMMHGDWDFEQQNLKVQVSGDLAFCHALNHARGTLKGGEEMDTWMRWSCCLRKLDGNWKIVHEHNSIPIDMESEKAVWNLKP